MPSLMSGVACPVARSGGFANSESPTEECQIWTSAVLPPGKHLRPVVFRLALHRVQRAQHFHGAAGRRNTGDARIGIDEVELAIRAPIAAPRIGGVPQHRDRGAATHRGNPEVAGAASKETRWTARRGRRTVPVRSRSPAAGERQAASGPGPTTGCRGCRGRCIRCGRHRGRWQSDGSTPRAVARPWERRC